jgi:hypothetical protein
MTAWKQSKQKGREKERQRGREKEKERERRTVGRKGGRGVQGRKEVIGISLFDCMYF